MPAAIHDKQERAVIAASVGYPSQLAGDFYMKWIHLRFSAKGRNAECLLTFKQYLKLASKAGLTHPDQIGKTRGCYQMSRRKDLGDYVWGNCRFLTVEQNQHEQTTNGGRRVGDLKRSRLLTGRSAKTHAGIAARALKISHSFVLKSPDGKKYKGRNVAAFAREHGLNVASMQCLCSGGQKQHKGWTGHYTD